MFYDTALINVFRLIINSRWYRFLAYTRAGVWTIQFFDSWMAKSSKRIRQRKKSIAEIMVAKINELESNVESLRKELDQIKQSIQKH